MSDQPDNPTEEISLDKDQVDCLLIVLTEHYQDLTEKLIEHKIYENKDYRDHNIDNLILVGEMTREDAEKVLDESWALDRSLYETIPTILQELKEVYPMLKEKSKFESQIKIIKPTWKTK